MLKSSMLFECGPPYIHLTSTRCHSCDRCPMIVGQYIAGSNSKANMKDLKQKKRWDNNIRSK